jgi:DNA-directed RNA polymerase I subunit RPA2
VQRRLDSNYPETIKIKIGNIPVMVRSKYCNLHDMSNLEMVKNKEDIHDFGGYFIINGIEKLIRMLVIPRRNYPIGFV